MPLTHKQPDVKVAAGHVVSTPSADPSDPIDRDELAYQMTDRAIARWHEAKRWSSIACQIDSGPVSNPWAVLANEQVHDAASHLISVIRAHDPGIHETDLNDCQRYVWKPRGVLMHGKLYAAIPNPDEDDEPENGKRHDHWIMRLVVLDVDRIKDLESKGASL